MAWDQIIKQWPAAVDALSARWSKLNAADLSQIAGDREQLIGLVQRHYSISRDVVEREIDQWAGEAWLAIQKSEILAEAEKVQAGIASLAQSTAESLSVGRDSVAGLVSDLDAAIKKNPTQAAMIGAGIGLIIGLLSRPRTDS